ncbi:lipocalin family protein [Hymenobacter weizhouensis]|uniref:lipocalin family protein n=1 Tax=Hymenobacter sp. YIM 151500-1 TaxID=2987689 RepID=UPI0022274BE9|nr:lipocalin family protein [Hymenobacter sp. YIM 151500-1]UYZ61966.1 lipocalin family protein [Hymenobacter sp. YIM 151500-1]
MQRNFWLVAVLAASSFLVGCGKKEKKEDPTPVRTKLNMLVEHEWAITGATTTAGGRAVDVFSTKLYEECKRDNLLQFASANNSNTYKRLENTKVCVPSLAESGTWTLSTDFTKLALKSTASTSTTATQEFTVVELTDTSLKISYQVELLSAPITVVESYKVK